MNKPPSKTPTSVNVSIIAKICNLSTARCSQLANEGHMHKAGHGKYLLFESITGYIRFLQRENVGLKKSDEPNYKTRGDKSARSRLEEAKAAIAELELERTTGTLVPTEAVVALFGEMTAHVRNSLLSIEGDFEDPKTRKKVRKLINDALVTFANYDPTEAIKRLLPENTADVEPSS